MEAQHRISTSRLADDAAAQAVLEALADEVKPVMPPAARRLHFLLGTPFRYGHRSESRFRRAGERPGIFYASEEEETALAEVAYWRLRFLSRSPGMALPTTTAEYAAFTVGLRVERALDLTAPPFDADAARWRDPEDYGACQRFAVAARGISAQLIRYASARRAEGVNLALLDPAGFADREPRPANTWHLRFEQGEMVALAAFPSMKRGRFGFAGFGLAGP